MRCHTSTPSLLLGLIWTLASFSGTFGNTPGNSTEPGPKTSGDQTEVTPSESSRNYVTSPKPPTKGIPDIPNTSLNDSATQDDLQVSTVPQPSPKNTNSDITTNKPLLVQTTPGQSSSSESNQPSPTTNPIPTTQPQTTSDVATTVDDLITTAGPDLYPCGKVSYKQKFTTTCNPCYATRAFGCPANSQFLREAPCYGRNFCVFECQLEVTFPQCCAGRWGPDCRLCPGAYTLEEADSDADSLLLNTTNVCSQRGVCSEGLEGNGTCVCEPAFGGFACEECASPEAYGKECNNSCNCVHGDCDAGVSGTGRCDCHIGYEGEQCDQLAQCNNSYCGDNAQCHGDLGQKCVCLHGYRGDGQNCTMIDMCREGSARCDGDAICEMIGPANYTCTCKDGYRGDGFLCDPIDPCQDLDTPVCPANSSTCEYAGPGKHKCKCLPGFANFTEGAGCAVVDLCEPRFKNCHENANCTMLSPNRYRCACYPGYVGNGKVCHGNILQSLKRMNTVRPLKNQLNKAIQLFQFGLGDALQHARYLTVFAPTDAGFKGVNLRLLMSDWAAGSQTVKNHILPVARNLHRLVNGTVFYTLEGSAAEISVVARKSQIRYRVARRSSRAKIIRGNFPASNGIIHVINKFVDAPPVIGHKKRKTLLQQLQQDGRYNRIESLLSSAGLNELLNSTTRNYTFFAPHNKVWDSLDDGVLTFLQSPKGKTKLVALLKNHIVVGNYFSYDMLMENRVKTLSNNIIEVTISPTGQILLNGNTTSVIQTDIPAANGLYHHITGILIPESIQPILNRRCDVNKTVVVPGKCGPCSADPQCLGASDVVLEDSYERCQFTRHLTDEIKATISGCRPKCNRTVIETQCCKNFFGPSCEPCPGGPTMPCGGRGECDQGIAGNGTCMCQQNFTGSLCHLCADPNKHGSNCSQDCKCEKGVCHNSIKSARGFCKHGTCEDGYFGVLCSLQQQKCGTLLHTHCHANAFCSFANSTQLLHSLLPGTEPGQVPYGHYSNLHFKLLQLRTLRKCVCKDGYEGNGVDFCTPIDPCEQPERGDCHKDAECKYLSPGLSMCKCNRGWVGDGYYCYPSTPCSHADDSTSLCHANAYCEPTVPGEYHCKCRYNFHGNGTYCVPINMCEFDNGGCSGLATCEALGPGNRTCTCMAGYGGDGLSCIGSLWHELQLRESLSQFMSLVRNTSLPTMLDNIHSHFTIFAPNNSVMVSAQQSGSSCVSSRIGVKYYIIPGRYSIDQLKQISTTATMNAHLPTLAQDGTGKARELKFTLATELTVNKVHIVSGNNTALNGLIHIIDGCLVPKQPASNLSHLLAANARYSKFTAALRQTGLMSHIEGLDSFTLFILDNVHWKVKLNGTDLLKYLSYYIVPKRVAMDTLPSFLQVETVLGYGPSSLLNITMRNGKVHVNDYEIYDDRLKTVSGMVYHLSHPLSPNLQRCDVQDHSGEYRRECCAGYYGYDCLPCPGGATSPCNDHGRCDSAITGTGKCNCEEEYTDKSCSTCAESYIAKGTECEEDPCYFCDVNADCIHRGNTTHCSCAESYVGDGTHCTHVCDVKNGGCDPNAQCTSSEDTAYRITCNCPPEFYGNGYNCTRIVSLLDSLKTLGMTQDFYTLLRMGEGGSDSEDYLTVKNSVNFTLIIPENWAGNVSINETGVDVKRHIVKEYFRLEPSLFDSNYSYLTLSGDELSMEYEQDERSYRINGSLVVQRNIPATNGILHIIDRPLRPPPITAPVTSENTFGTMAIVIGVLAVVLVLMIIVVALLLWKCRRHCCHKSDSGQSGSGFKFLMLDDKDEHCKEAGIIDAASTYHNPLYDTLESAGLTEESIW